ncbi:unnamed protein product [Onchocerca ochengi]|uniref:ZM domain-containing protein n=1 Tax=Onchocerca ochengi TaxID=42157 RepID=A0A182EA14_ONCOC|nr:unnamed protein product [Onchocerca ochengi]
MSKNGVSSPSASYQSDAPNSTNNRIERTWAITRKQPSQFEFTQSKLLEQQILRESSSSTIPSYFDDHHHYRFLRTFTPVPYRSPLHTSTISLPDIKEVTPEENDSSCYSSNNSVKHDKKTVNFYDRNIRSSSEQNLDFESSNNRITSNDQEIKKNVNAIQQNHDEQLEIPWSSDTCKSSTIQKLYPSEGNDIICSNRNSRFVEKNQKPPISITVQIVHPNSNHRTICTNQNELDCSNKSKIVHEMNKNFDYPSDLLVPSQIPSDTSESPHSYSNDSGKQPKSILKHRPVSSCKTNDDTSRRSVERVQINDSSHKEKRQQHRDQSCDSSARIGQSSHSSNPTSESIGRENRLYQIMQENLRQQNLRPQTPRHLPQASFNGPFFTLEEVHTEQQRQSIKSDNQIPLEEYYVESDHQLMRRQRQDSADDSNHKLKSDSRSKSVSVMEMNRMEPEKNNEISESFVHWSSPSKQKHERARSVPPSLRPKNITDPDRIDEYQRQKELELEAIRRKEEETMFWGKKQSRASEIQEHLYFGQMQSRRDITSPELSESMTQSHEELQRIDINAQKRQKELYFEKNLEPYLMRVYETRPITATSEEGEKQESIFSPNPVTWKRLYIVDQSKPVAKNEIITSEQLLEKERFDIDLLKRREAFIEKPKPELKIFRTGKRWKPPPEQSYVWPHAHKASNTEPSLESSSNYSTDHAVDRTVESAEFRWQPVVYDPEYKQEHKSFTPESSLPYIPRGFGPGPLDEPAKRQIKYLVQPLPDGSHRPKPAFGGPRLTPSGGFYPHAPNAVKILKKKHLKNLPESNNADPDKEVEIIHQRKFHRLGEIPSNTTSSRCYDIADWEKIYDLPPHSSTITSYDTPRNVNVREKLAAFENTIRQTTPSISLRLDSGDTHRPPSSIHAFNIDDGLQSPNVTQINRNGQYLRHQQRLRQQLLSPTSVRTDTTDSSQQSHQQQRKERQIIPSNTSLIRQINQRNENHGNRTRFAIHSDGYQQHGRKMSAPKSLRPIRDPVEYTRHHHQHRIPIFRSGRTSAPCQHQQLLQVQPPGSVASSRRLTRIPIDCTMDRSNPHVVEIKRLSSRTPTILQW